MFLNYTFIAAALGVSVLGAASGMLGTFTVLRRQSLLGDAISHSALPGILLIFLITGSKSSMMLMLGALGAGLAAIVLINTVTKHSKTNFDSTIAVVMSVLFGLGIVFLTYSQKIPDASQAGLNKYLFGQAASITTQDIILILCCAVVSLILVLIFYKELKLLTFDREFAALSGFSPNLIQSILSFLTVLIIVIGLQSVGVVLMSSLIVAPAVAARQWCGTLGKMLFLSMTFGSLSGILGTAASHLIPNVPTGPAIVLCASIIVMISLPARAKSRRGAP